MVPASVHKVLNLLGDARVAGGAVRDSLMGVEPKDWDVATSLMPEAVLKAAKTQGWTTVFNDNSLAHGTVTLMVDGEPIEVTTLRVDEVTDGRHAEVSFTDDWKLDAARRDLTFNAMFMDADGEVEDFFNGVADLVEGRVRFVGNASARLQEDYLRVLRFFRFAGRMSASHWDMEALRAVKRNVNGLNRVSGERVWMELSKILTGPMVGEVLEQMVAHNVFDSLGFKDLDVEHAVLANWMGGKPETVLAALLDTPEAVEKATAEWKLSKAEREMAKFVASHTHDRVRVQNWTEMDWMKLMVMEGRERVLELLSLTNHSVWKDEVLATRGVPVFPLTGAALVNAGVKPGPDMGRRLKAAKQAWLDSDFTLSGKKLLQLAVAM